MYPQPKSSLRKKLLIIAAVVLLLVGLIALVGAVTKKQKTTAINNNLSEYNDPLFTIKYPKNFVPSIDNDIDTSFRPPADQKSLESIKVTSQGSKESGITINNVDKPFKSGTTKDNTTAFTTQKTKINKTDVAILTKNGTDKTMIKLVYMFYPETTWIVTVTYYPDSELDRAFNTILDSFRPKEQTNNDQDQLPDSANTNDTQTVTQ